MYTGAKGVIVNAENTELGNIFSENFIVVSFERYLEPRTWNWKIKRKLVTQYTNHFTQRHDHYKKKYKSSHVTNLQYMTNFDNIVTAFISGRFCARNS